MGHGEEGPAVLFAHLVDRHDVGVLEAGDGLCLGVEAGQLLPAGSPYSLDFNYVLQTESLTGYDLAQLQVSTNGGTTWVTLATYNALAESTTWRAATTVSSPRPGRSANPTTRKFDWCTRSSSAVSAVAPAS